MKGNTWKCSVRRNGKFVSVYDRALNHWKLKLHIHVDITIETRRALGKIQLKWDYTMKIFYWHEIKSSPDSIETTLILDKSHLKWDHPLAYYTRRNILIRLDQNETSYDKIKLKRFKV